MATRADIIEKLFHSFLIEKKGNEILITSKGKQLLELVPEDLKKPELTAKWELELPTLPKAPTKTPSSLPRYRITPRNLSRRSRQRTVPSAMII